MSQTPTPGAPPPSAPSSPPQAVSFFGTHKTLHIILAVVTFGLWLLVLLALYLWRKDRKVWSIATAAGLGLIVLLIGIGAATPTDEETASPETVTVTETEATEETTTEEQTTTEKQPPKPVSPKQRVVVAVGNEVSAGGYAGDVKIQDVSFDGREAQVTATTPEGGFQGASCGDLNDGAQAIFQTVYNDGGWNGGAAVIFKGGLVSTTTGAELPDVNTGIFTMPALRARQINWSDDDALLNIDWSLYRDFCHPALQ